MRKERPKPPPKDATYVTEGYYAGPRRAVLNKLSVSFEARAQARLWKKLIRELSFPFDEGAHSSSAAFVALPPRVESLTPYLIGEFHLSAQAPDTAQWTFEWARAPSEPPPAEMIAVSKAVGGFPKILEKMGRWWPTSAPLQMRASATYFLDADEWDVGLPSSQSSKGQAGNRSRRLIPTHWRVEPPAGIVEEVILEPESEEDDYLFLTGKGLFLQKWTPQFLNDVDGAIWSSLRTLIKRR